VINPETLATVSTAMTSVLGLLGQFKSGRDGAKSQDFNEFMAFLVEGGHAEIKSMIEANHTTTIGIKAVLKQQASELDAALARLDDMLSLFASTISGFAEISAGLKPQSPISPQALNILRQMEDSGTSKFVEYKNNKGTRLQALDGDRSALTFEEPVFLQDDLERLTRFDLLTLSANNSGERIFHYTRAAHELIKAKG